ncbi:MAG: hypothetical protein WC375_03420 [Methanomassiliicoccales archaeon]|jgi:hypothetical protein
MSSLSVARLVIGIRVPASKFTYDSVERGCKCSIAKKGMQFCPECGKHAWNRCRKPAIPCEKSLDGGYVTKLPSGRKFDVVFYEEAVVGHNMPYGEDPVYVESHVYIGKLFSVVSSGSLISADSNDDVLINPKKIDMNELYASLVAELTSRAMWASSRFGYWLITRMD